MPLLLLFIFVLLPLAELYVIIQVGGAIGVLPTLALLLLDGFLGAALTRTQGRTVWRRFNEAMAAGRVPGREVMDGAMIVFGGALLLSPGFLTDILGFALLLPPSRALFRRILKGMASKTAAGRPVFFVYDRYGGGSGGASGSAGPDGGGGTGGARPPRGGRGPGAGGDYDVDGSAREIPDEERTLPPETEQE